MTIQQAYQQLLLNLYDIYENREAANIADWVIENVTGFKKIDRIINKSFPFNNEQQEKFELFSKQLSEHKPVQYVLGEAWFAGMKLYVDENVLIPRPETEELVEWVVEEVRKLKIGKGKGEASFSLLDIGTGSGCIPVAIKKQLPGVNVSALDVSEGALKVAKRNASEQDISIQFLLTDFLNDENLENLPCLDVIISNPPYIKQSEEATMQRNVLDHEPHLALFVPDEDALIFYKKIAQFALTHLKENGFIFLEINEALALDVIMLFKDHEYKLVEVRKDMQGKERMIKVMK